MYLSDCGMLLEIQRMGKERESRWSNTCLKTKSTPKEKVLDGFVFVCSEVMATEHSFSKINCFSILKKKIRWKWCKGTSFYLNQMNQFVPKQRSYLGEFAPESAYLIRTECNSCPKAITVRAWCSRQALSSNMKTKVRFLHLYDVEIHILEHNLKLLVVWDFSSRYSFQKDCNLFEVPYG